MRGVLGNPMEKLVGRGDYLSRLFVAHPPVMRSHGCRMMRRDLSMDAEVVGNLLYLLCISAPPQ